MSTINAVGTGLVGSSGTGSFAGTTSPTFVTPVLGAATATSLATTNLSFDVTANSILSTNTNGNIALIPNGTGIVSILSATSIATPDGSFGDIQISKNSHAGSLAIFNYLSTNSAANMLFLRSKSNTIGSFSAVSNGDHVGQLSFNADDGSAFRNCGLYRTTVSGTVSSGIVPTEMTWRTTNTSGVLTLGMTLSNAQVLTLANALPVTSGGTGQTSALVANNLIYAASANTMAALATANSSVLITDSSGVPAWSGSATNGQLLIGSTGASPALATLTAGAGISITNGAASITVANTGAASGAFVFNSVSGTSQAAAAGNAYILNNAGATTVTLPTTGSSTIGDTIKIKGRSAAAWIIQANTGQTITYGATSSTVAGTATSAAGTDSLQLVYVAADEWSVDWALSSGIILA